jgi:exonuclease SbcC
MRGFSTFRAMPEPIDFTEADLFALTGPTGAGKSTILDALCFALYGRVPRLPGNAVEPVISLGALEAKVAFEFSVEERILLAVRVVRRTKTGATTPEARLEEVTGTGNAVLASGADDVTAAVEEVLGLTFEHFTKAVLLPQGDFAAFLHDTPARRQDLLRTLLDLGVYEQMRVRVQDRRARAEGEADLLTLQADELAAATEEAVAAAADRVAGLDALLAELSLLQPEIGRLTSERDEIDAVLAGLAGEIEVLSAVTEPPDVTAVSGRSVQARTGVEAAASDAEMARRALIECEGAVGAMTPESDLRAIAARWSEYDDLGERLERGAALVSEAETGLSDARAGLDAVTVMAAHARHELEELRRLHMAAGLRAGLAPGDDCPVCGRPYERPPDARGEPDVPAGQARVAEAEAEMEVAMAEAATAEARAVSYRDALATLRGRLAEVAGELAGAAGADEVADHLRARAAAVAALDDARNADRMATDVLTAARAEAEEAERAVTEARRQFLAARDRVVALGPPEAWLEDLAADWKELSAWASETMDARAREAEERRRRLEEIRQRLAEIDDHVVGRISATGVAPDPADPLGSLGRELAEARSRHERVAADRRRHGELRVQAAGRRKDAELARSMAGHLSARGFEGWLLEEALVSLVDGANQLLVDLSAGAYSLQVDRRDFVIVDHRNADEERSVKTLSGGETFLVSLALALSLAEQIGSLGTFGPARLESIFLDEGFGALDSETLDTVTAVIGELGAGGRTVGIVTHVKELAELVPTRFEVTKGPSGSTVTRVTS